MEIKGKIIEIQELKTGISQKTGTPWASQMYVIETQEQYPKRCYFEVFGEERIRQFALRVGDNVSVSFDIMAEQYNGNWYNRIRAWNAVKC